MAYASQELKAKVIGLIKDYAKEAGVQLKINSKIHHHSSLKVNISACSIDLRANMIETLEKRLEAFKAEGNYSVSEFNSASKMLEKTKNMTAEYMETYGIGFNLHYLNHFFSGDALALIQGMIKAIKCDHYNHSDPTTDYFNVAYYWELTIGKNKGGLALKS